jgi:Domain of unknown function (DUF4129)
MSRMSFLVLLLLMLVQCVTVRAQVAPSNGSDAEIRKGLSKYPWYDADTDSAVGLWTPRTVEEPPSADLTGWQRVLQWIGRAFVYLIFGAGLLLIIILIARYLGRIEFPSDEVSRRGPSRRLASEGALPPGMEDVADPWLAAIEARKRGDLARTIVMLFAHQLLLLERHGQVRLVPGRTGRQLVRSVREAELKGLVGPTLRLFESVYYGHRSPSMEQVDSAWKDTESLGQLLESKASR